MKTLITILCLMFTVPAFAVDVTQAVFSITSSAATSTANLRIVPMDSRFLSKDKDGHVMQTMSWEAGKLQNLFLTKNTTVDMTNVLCVWVQTDQDTNIKLNTESVTLKIYSRVDQTICFK